MHLIHFLLILADFTAVSPVYTISRTLPSIDTSTTTATYNREGSRNSSLNIDSTMEKSGK